MDWEAFLGPFFSSANKTLWSIGYIHATINDNISGMTWRHTTALIAGAAVTATAFVAAMALFIYGEIFPERDWLIMVSIALGPIAMLSVMVGYAVWWFVLFLLSLFSAD